MHKHIYTHIFRYIYIYKHMYILRDMKKCLKTLFQLDKNVGDSLDSVSTLLQYWLQLTLNTLVSKEVVTNLLSFIVSFSCIINKYFKFTTYK